MISPAELKKLQDTTKDTLEKEIESCMPAIMQTVEDKLIAYAKKVHDTFECSILIDDLIDPRINHTHARGHFVAAICYEILAAGYHYSFSNSKTHIVIRWK